MLSIDFIPLCAYNGHIIRKDITDMGANQRLVFVNNLKRYMERRHVEQSDIVTALNVSASTVSDWANGKKYPRVDAMQRLADYLGVVISDLTNEEKEEQPAPADPRETELLGLYRGLNDNGQHTLLKYAHYLDADPDMKRGTTSENETA